MHDTVSFRITEPIHTHECLHRYVPVPRVGDVYEGLTLDPDTVELQLAGGIVVMAPAASVERIVLDGRAPDSSCTQGWGGGLWTTRH